MTQTAKDKMIEAALLHVPFDGWSETTFKAAADDCGIDHAEARELFPKGGLDLAIGFHQLGDAAMAKRLAQENLWSLKYSERVAFAVRLRLEASEGHKEAVQRGTSFFALPQNAAYGTKLIWGTADAIWSALGDQSEDYNWYSKRATLSGVYGATVLFWLGDTSDGHQATWEFLDRRISNVMQIEKLKAQMNENPVASRLLAGPNWLLSKIRKPSEMADPNLPGFFRQDTK